MRSPCITNLALPFAVAALGLCSACSSIVDSTTQKLGYMRSYAAGDFATAARLSADKASSRGDSGDGLMWYLEAGKCAFSAGDYKGALGFFEAAEAKAEEFDKRAVVSARDLSSEAASAVTNPNAIPYRGSYMDREMLNAYKALCYFALGKPEDACVELRRMHERQKKAVAGREAELKAADELALKNNMNLSSMMASSPEMIRNSAQVNAHAYKSYANLMNPFCCYLSFIGYVWRGDLNEAMVDLRNLRAMDPANEMIKRDFVTVSRLAGQQVPADLEKTPSYGHSLRNGVVFLIVENGLAPYRHAETVHMFLPPPVGYTGFAFPALVFNPPAIGRVDWSSNLGSAGATGRVCDMDAVVAYEYKDALKPMLVRTLVSILIKEGASATAYEVVKHNASSKRDGDAAANLILLAASLWKYTFNTADTRSWQTLPKEFQATSFPMPGDGVLRLGVDGGPVKCVYQLDRSKKMTIVYVQSPGNGVFSVKVFQFD